jgi:predicted nucleic acid-binding protein
MPIGADDVIYLDTSVVLAELLAEDRRADSRVWISPLVSSRLVVYETWTRINDRGLATSHGDAVRELVGRVALVELSPIVLQRALDPFPVPVRTLDALHLATIEYLRAQRVPLSIASFDERMLAAAAALQVPIEAI